MLIYTGADGDTRMKAALKTACGLLGVDHPCPDLIIVDHEKEKTVSVEEIRVKVCDDVFIRPFRAEKKVYIIPDAEMMTAQAQNALLKTLEEPPEYVFIILLAANEALLLDTIKSRCGIRYLNNDAAAEPTTEVERARQLYRDALIYKKTKELLCGGSEEYISKVKELARKEYSELSDGLMIIDKTEERLAGNVNPEISLSIMKGKI